MMEKVEQMLTKWHSRLYSDGSVWNGTKLGKKFSLYSFNPLLNKWNFLYPKKPNAGNPPSITMYSRMVDWFSFGQPKILFKFFPFLRIDKGCQAFTLSNSQAQGWCQVCHVCVGNFYLLNNESEHCKTSSLSSSMTHTKLLYQIRAILKFNKKPIKKSI